MIELKNWRQRRRFLHLVDEPRCRLRRIEGVRVAELVVLNYIVDRNARVVVVNIHQLRICPARQATRFRWIIYKRRERRGRSQIKLQVSPLVTWRGMGRAAAAAGPASVAWCGGWPGLA